MIDVLAIAAHPDDCEIFMGGTLLHLKSIGYKTGICDLTRGEAGTLGSPEQRADEATKAAELLGLDERVTLDIPDGNVRNTEENRLEVIKVIRSLRPEIIYTSMNDSRHPDHSHAGDMVKEALFLAGLKKIETGQEPWRPSTLVRFPELAFNSKPDFIIDITPYYEKKIEVIRAYGTQVADPDKREDAKTMIHSQAFWEVLEARSRMAGHMAGVTWGEPFFSKQPPRLLDPVKALTRDLK